MTFTALEIPDSNAELAAWFEQHLTGLHLADLIAGLEVFRHEAGEGPSLDTLLNGRQPAVFEQGLAALAEPQLIALLRHPRLLLPLQERVLTRGGTYWQSQPISAEHRRLIAQGWSQLESRTAPQATAAASPRGGGSARRAPWRRVLTIAALLLVAVFGWQRWQQTAPAPTGWGWDKPGALAAADSPQVYLNQLAAGAQDWFNKRPDTAEALRTRIAQFRHGCDTLIAAPHEPLAAADRDWLRERCTAWSGKLDEHLAALDAGRPVLEVRDAADATVNKMMTALRERAAGLA